MAYSIEILEGANTDINEALFHYMIVSEQLGIKFLEDYENRLLELGNNPFFFPFIKINHLEEYYLKTSLT